MKKLIFIGMILMGIISTNLYAQSPTPVPPYGWITKIASFQDESDDIGATDINYLTNMGLTLHGKLEFVLVYFETPQNGTITVYKRLVGGTEVLMYTDTKTNVPSIVWAPSGNNIFKHQEQMRVIVEGTDSGKGILQFFISAFPY